MKELKTKNDKDLTKVLAEKREALRVLRFGGAGAKNKNVKLAKNTKKEVAQILTELSSRGNK